MEGTSEERGEIRREGKTSLLKSFSQDIHILILLFDFTEQSLDLGLVVVAIGLQSGDLLKEVLNVIIFCCDGVGELTDVIVEGFSLLLVALCHDLEERRLAKGGVGNST